MNEMTLWTQCLAAFNDVLSEKQMKTWFHPLEVKQISNTLKVVAPNKFIKDEIQNEYLILIKETVFDKSENQISSARKKESKGEDKDKTTKKSKIEPQKRRKG